jgi:hypothetical protein
MYADGGLRDPRTDCPKIYQAFVKKTLKFAFSEAAKGNFIFPGLPLSFLS